MAVSAGGVAAVVRVLQQGPDDAKWNAAAALSTITESEQYRDVAASSGGVAALATVLQQGPDDAKDHDSVALC